MSAVPSETLTFLMTDIEGSTRLWQQFDARMREVVHRHDEIADEIVARHRGRLVKSRGEGDSLFIVFGSAADACACACALQAAFCSEPWPIPEPLRVRMALHTGAIYGGENDYYGVPINRCARIRGTAHGGQILLSEPTAALAREIGLPEAAYLRDLKMHRLRDLEQPEHVFQLCRPGLPLEFPALNSLEAYTHNLPVQLTGFIGREREIGTVKDLLAAKRLLTLRGPGGCGKTRLALQAAVEAIDRFPDGVRWVELAALADPGLIATTAAQALGVREQLGCSPEQALKEHLRDRSLLLLLDNCEHLTDGCAGLVSDLLVNCPGLRVLATSQRPLGIPGETTYDVPCLAQPHAGDLMPLDEFLQVESVRLLTDRARNVRPDFAITQSTAPVVARLCRRLDGIPLAIELAVARIGVLSITQIEERLEKVLTLPPMHASRPQHKTIRALIDWSHDQLTDAERALFRRLAVFAGGWTLEASEAVCTDDLIEFGDVIELLSNLSGASLILTDTQGASQRYRLLETVRQYALQRLEEAGEADMFRDRHLEYYLGIAEESEPQLTGARQAEMLERLNADRDNLRAAFTWGVRNDKCLRMAGALWRYWYLGGDFSEGCGRLEACLAKNPSSAPLVRARASSGLGVLLTRKGDHPAALSALEKSLGIYTGLADRKGIGETLNHLGILMYDRGDYGSAKGYLKNSLALWRELQDLRGVSLALSNLGMVVSALGDPALSRDYYTQALQIDRAIGDAAGIGVGLCNLGDIETRAGNYARAYTLFEECLGIFDELGNRWYSAVVLSNLGDVLYKLGDLEAAAKMLVKGLSQRCRIGDEYGAGYPLRTLACIAADEGRPLVCAALLGAQDRVCRDSHNKWKEADDEILIYERKMRSIVPEEDFNRAWLEGRQTSADDLVEWVERLLSR